ncbi:triose-phosphate transporter family-domain-containing protein [Xylaria bambusicola]|uniref:triose-phosphate transporter family-domain-containing protein n=1 Tax=Xylaria bambusicola TaxID=326684 RepID=UPI002008519F|nr:triose-phosphate transporter family-domain-containing protein [Xylaria bambusicola]KAI0525843.1 triose-phosphate transporter family-domain-containing protein [Xylaria bambusicola]
MRDTIPIQKTMPPPPLLSQQSPLVPQRQNYHQQQRSARSLTRHPAPEALSVSSALAPSSANNDLSNPPSASSATTSFQIDWSSDGGPSSAASAHRRPEDIEMDTIAPTSHRRRRSTLSAGLNASVSPNARTGRPRATSIKNTGDVEPKISEEDAAAYIARPNARDDDSLSDEDLHDDEETGLTSKDKRRKQDKRRRNTRLDQRIARDNLTDEERKQADQNVIRRLAINAVLIGLWYIFSLSISLYNKWMFDSGQLNFPFPLFTTSMHMLVQFSLASLVLYFIPSLRPNNAPRSSDLGRSRHESEPERPIMTKLFYLTRIGPCGAATGLDIGLGNTSLKFITLTFYTMCKSSALAFVLLFAFVFRLETPTWRLVGIIATMTAGVIMMVAGEVEFHLGGFVLIISSAFFSGFRWGLTQILLLRHPATSNPFSSIFFLTPIMFATLLFIALPVEGFLNFWNAFQTLSAEWGFLKAPLLLLFPGTIAFLMTASEFALLQRSSVVTLSIAGIFKEVVTIIVAALVFDDKLTPINISGLLVTLIAIIAYNYIKLTKMRREAQIDAHSKSYQQEHSDSSTERGDDADDEDAMLLTHEEDSDVEGNHVTIDGDLMPRSKTPRSQEDGRQSRMDRQRND